MAIRIENNCDCDVPVYVRINSQDSGSDKWKEIHFGETATWKRPRGIHQVQISMDPENAIDPVFEVESPGDYFIADDLALYDTTSSEQMPMTDDPFMSASTIVSSNQININSTVELQGDGVEIENRCFYEIYARVSAHGGGSEEFVVILPMSREVFERKAGTTCYLEYNLNPVPFKGIAVEVVSGMTYYIDMDFCIKNMNGQIVNSLVPQFISAKAGNNNNQKNQTTDNTFSFPTNKETSTEPGVKVTNKTFCVLFVRVSAQGGGSEKWVSILPSSTYSFPRKENQNFHMQYNFSEGNSGPTVNVRAGESYTILEDFNVQDVQGRILPFSSDPFRSVDESSIQVVTPNIIQPSNDITSDFKSVFKKLGIAPVDKRIVIINNTNQEIKARVKKNQAGSEDYFPIAANSQDSWARENGTYFATILCSGSDFKYYLKTNAAYIFYSDYSLVDFNGNKMPLSTDSFEKSNSGQVITNFKFPLKINLNPDLIYVVNCGFYPVNFRIQKKIQGSEDYFVIPSGNYDSWRRERNEKYIIEAMANNKTSRFYVEPNNAYAFKDNALVDYYGRVLIMTYDAFDNKAKPVAPVNPNNNSTNSTTVNNKPKKIKLKNKTNVVIYARVKSSGQGSEDIFNINPGAEDAWSREVGTYLTEIIIDSDKKYRFYLQSQNDYTFTADKQLLNDATQKAVSPTQDNTFQPSRFDKDPQPGTNTNTNNKNNTNNVTPAVVVEPEVPYWKNIKPNYNGTSMFVDSTFPPEMRILNSLDENGHKIKPNFAHADDGEIDESDVVFKRPSKIWGENYHLFKDTIEYEDVKQGQIGNCYLISVIAALARRPNLVESLFKTRSVNKHGFYEIYFYEKGQKRTMFVDDHFVQRYGDFLFAKPNGGEIWVLLLEKAFAKYEGGFSNIEGGLPSDPLKFLTGAITRDHSKIKRCWDELVSAIKKGHICTAGSKSQSGMTDKECTPGGIYYGHAYSITDAREYNDGNRVLRLVQLRNPWGQGEWKGAFSDSSKDWTPELKVYFNLSDCDKEDGRFWMPLDDFEREFDYLTICYC
jgi:hypothetical protein